MRVLCLILASDTAPEYLKFQKLWRRIMKINKHVDCFFYKGHPNLTSSEFLEDDTLWIKIDETFDTVYEKTLRAFEYFIPKLDQYDFVYRSNLSTFVSFENMLKFCETLPKTMSCAAVVGGIPPEDKERNSTKYEFSFPGGNGFLISPDLVKRLVKEKFPLVAQDDVTIGIALRTWGVRIHEFVRPDLSNEGVWYINNYNLLAPNERNMSPKPIMFTYRLKTGDREQDLRKMDSLIKSIYNV